MITGSEKIRTILAFAGLSNYRLTFPPPSRIFLSLRFAVRKILSASETAPAISSVNTAKDGTVTKGISFGPNPAGRIVFTSSGHYVTVNTNPNLPKFASGNRAQGTAEENKAVVKGSIAGFGTYSVSADGKILTMKQEGGTWALRNGVEEKRSFALSGDDLKYTTAATVGGTSELLYKRVK